MHSNSQLCPREYISKYCILADELQFG